jgi:hypothetical protein
VLEAGHHGEADLVPQLLLEQVLEEPLSEGQVAVERVALDTEVLDEQLVRPAVSCFLAGKAARLFDQPRVVQAGNLAGSVAGQRAGQHAEVVLARYTVAAVP